MAWLTTVVLATSIMFLGGVEAGILENNRCMGQYDTNIWGSVNDICKSCFKIEFDLENHPQCLNKCSQYLQDCIEVLQRMIEFEKPPTNKKKRSMRQIYK